MKILVSPTSFKQPQNDKARNMLEKFADEILYNPFDRPLQSEEVAELIKDCDGYIAGLDYINEKALANAEKLKVISRYGAGVDRVDLNAAKEKNIVVTNTPGTNAIAVCELALGLMLSLARSIPRLDNEVKKGRWPRINGIELKDKRLTILGLGAIGKNLALRALALGMIISAYDPFADEAFAKANGIVICSFEEAVKNADFISLHMPLTNETRHCIDENAIEMMKDGAMIINTARGGLIDEAAAHKALVEGKLGGLALDAFEQEPVFDSPLALLDNVIFTPHTGAHTNEAISAMGVMSVENLISALTKSHNRNVVNTGI